MTLLLLLTGGSGAAPVADVKGYTTASDASADGSTATDVNANASAASDAAADGSTASDA